MSFLYIKDSKKRNEIVAEYWLTRKEKSENDTTTTTAINDEQRKSKENDKEQCNNNQEVPHGIELANCIQNEMKILKSEDMDENIDRTILRNIIGIKRKYHHNDSDITTVRSEINNRVIFLPGDIKGLQTKLNYLLGEYQAGNTIATHNQIVAIANELIRRKQLSQVQHHNINKLLNNETSH